MTSRRDEAGASAVEYALLVALIAGVIVIAMIAFGGIVTNSFQDSCESLRDDGPIGASC